MVGFAVLFRWTHSTQALHCCPQKRLTCMDAACSCTAAACSRSTLSAFAASAYRCQPCRQACRRYRRVNVSATCSLRAASSCWAAVPCDCRSAAPARVIARQVASALRSLQQRFRRHLSQQHVKPVKGCHTVCAGAGAFSGNKNSASAAGTGG